MRKFRMEEITSSRIFRFISSGSSFGARPSMRNIPALPHRLRAARSARSWGRLAPGTRPNPISYFRPSSSHAPTGACKGQSPSWPSCSGEGCLKRAAAVLATQDTVGSLQDAALRSCVWSWARCTAKWFYNPWGGGAQRSGACLLSCTERNVVDGNMQRLCLKEMNMSWSSQNRPAFEVLSGPKMKETKIRTRKGHLDPQ